MKHTQITRRRFLKGAAVAGLATVGAQIMAACAPVATTGGGEAGSATGSSSAPAATQVTIRVQVPPDSQNVMPKKFAEKYQADSGVQVVVEETVYAEIATKTQTGFISGTLQDVVYGHNRWLFLNYLKGIYMEIDDLLATNPPSDFADIYPSVMAANSLNGKNFSIPGVVHPGGNIAVNFNKTMLEAKGLPLPQEGWTFAQWTELAKAAAEPDNGIFGLSFDSMNALHYYNNVSRSFGDPGSKDMWILNEDGTKIQYNTPVHEEIANWYLDLLNSKVSPRTADYIDNSAANLFPAGLTATHASIVGQTTAFIAQIAGKFEMDAVPLPVGPKGRQGTNYSGNQHMINSKTAHPEESWELLKLYSSGEAGVSMVLDGKLQPNGHKSAWTNEEVNKINRMFGITNTLLEKGIEPFPMPKNARFVEANPAFQAEIDLIWEGQAEWKEHAAVVDEKVQAILDMPLPE
ncbi:MAG: substrate-binding domain-containing protein [Caldilineaceae bacterium]